MYDGFVKLKMSFPSDIVGSSEEIESLALVYPGTLANFVRIIPDRWKPAVCSIYYVSNISQELIFSIIINGFGLYWSIIKLRL